MKNHCKKCEIGKKLDKQIHGENANFKNGLCTECNKGVKNEGKSN